MSYSGVNPYHYGEPWDGFSAQISLESMKIERLKSSVALLSQKWQEAQVKRILARGGTIFANGAPVTRTMAQFHIPRFAETGMASNAVLTHLFTPIALGDHLTEFSQADAYRSMVMALDFGCVYAFYDDLEFTLTYPTLTSYMYPITPLRLGNGFIIGKERILTNRSGLFGWNDDSKHEVHVFDEEGREVRKFKAPTVTRGGKTFTELRIGEGWSAAIVRVKP
jgi:hypothetical protein